MRVGVCMRVIHRPKDARGCPAAPEEPSPTAFLVLSLLVLRLPKGVQSRPQTRWSFFPDRSHFLGIFPPPLPAVAPHVHGVQDQCRSFLLTLESGRGGGGHVAFGVLLSSAAGGAYRPIVIRCPSLGPSPSIGGGAHRLPTARCPPSSSLAYLSLSTSLSFILVGCANGAPGLSLFRCSVSGPHGGGGEALGGGGGGWS